MGYPKGFLEYDRQGPAHRPKEERIGDFKEFILPIPEEHLQTQAARCMDCGVPFCHDGCPLGNLIPEFNDAVYQGKWQAAYRLLAKTNPFPEFTGRICPAPCEKSCVLGINQDPVTIESIEKEIAEAAFTNGWVVPQPPEQRTGKQVAVIGSGPAGMAAAYYLNQQGHNVTVFERDETPGGLLRYGVPDFKLEKWVIDRRVAIMEQEGVVFRCNTSIGEDISVEALRSEYDAIVMCTGAPAPRDMRIEGRDLPGVHFAMEYLTQQNRRVAGMWQESPASILAAGKDVLVIGGGDTGSDCIGTANRQGARSVTQITWGPVPALTRPEDNPWPEWPMVLESSSSHEEGCERSWSVLSKAFLPDEHGHLRALQVVNIEWTDGRKSYQELPETLRELPCQLVLIAVGFTGAEPGSLWDQLGVELDAKGRLVGPTFHTSQPGIFSAGDLRRGQSLVVWAQAEGRDAAKACHRYLMEQAQ